MINFDFLTLRAFFLENIDFIIGSRLQKIQQPTRRDLILFLRNNHESRKLYINIDPQIYHTAFMSSNNEEKRGIDIPKKPPMFCMLLRKYLEGSKISDACVVENERILELHFDTCDEFAQRKSLCLAVELMGKHSNAILYDRETSLIIGCAHNVGSDKSRYRELRGGVRYIYPPQKENIVLPDELKKQFQNLSQEEIEKYLCAETFRPAIINDRYTLFQELIEDSMPHTSVNSMIDNYYSEYQERNNLQASKHKLDEIVFAKLNKINNTIEKTENLLKKRNSGEKYKLYGELLTSNLYKKADYISNIELFDYQNNKNITIELDNTMTMNENAQRYFKLYTKFKTTKEKTTKILEALAIDKSYLENVLYSIERSENTKDLKAIQAELGLNKTKERPKNKADILKLDINGFDVYIGKNNRQNDFIVSKLSTDEDYWFHTKMCAGSHVLLKVFNDEPDKKTIYECAKLAREYSSAKQPSKVGVIYTKRKYIKKPPASPLGYVTYKNEKEILI